MQNIIQLGSSLYLNGVDDLYPGGGSASPGAVPGQLGMRIELNARDALKLSDSSVGTLYPGVYQYVKFKASPTTAATRALLLNWNDMDDYEVSVDAASDIGSSRVAGVALGTVTSGQYGWIQTGGLATVKFKSSTTKTTPVVGDSVMGGLDADNGLADVLADATAVVFGTAAAKLGRQIGRLETAVGSQLATVQLWDLCPNPGN